MASKMKNSLRLLKESSAKRSTRAKRIFFALIYCIFGLNFIPSSGFKRIAINVYCLGIAFITTAGLSFYFITENTALNIVPLVFMTFEYLVAVIGSCVLNKSIMLYGDAVCKVQDKLSRSSVGKKELEKLQVVHFYMIMLIFARKIIYCIGVYLILDIVSMKYFVSKTLTLTTIVFTLSYHFMSMAIEMKQIPRMLFFCLIYYRFKNLRDKIDLAFKNKNLFIINWTENYGSSSIFNYFKQYKQILDEVDTAASTIDPMFIISLVCCVPRVMYIVYDLLSLLKDTQVSLLYTVILSTEVAVVLTLPCISGIVTEVISKQVDSIKINLMHEAFDCPNERLRGDTEDFIRYIEMRPFKYSIWRVIPVDLSILVGMISLCTTYLIVVIQITHLYE